MPDSRRPIRRLVKNRRRREIFPAFSRFAGGGRRRQPDPGAFQKVEMAIEVNAPVFLVY